MDNNALRFENIFRQSYSTNLLELSDGRLRTEDGHSFDVHRVILAQNSEYFYAMFCDTRTRTDILIPGIRGDILSNILTYIYTRNLYITKANICDLLEAADYLLLDELIMDIRRQLFCHISVSNCLSLFATVLQMNHSDILRQSLRFILMHFEVIVQDDDSEFSELPLEIFKKILSDRNLRLRDENPAWLAIVKWIQVDISNRQCHVPDLLLYLTIRDVDEPLSSRIVENSIVADNPSCNEIYQMKASNSFTTNFGILFHYFWNHSQPALPLYRLRQPTHLYFIAHYCFTNEFSPYQIYVTYDENIDLWRNITDLRAEYPAHVHSEFLVSLGFNIYVFRSGRSICYNLEDEERIEIRNGQILQPYGVVMLDGLIYVLGYKNYRGFDREEGIEIYDPERNVWRNVAALNPARTFSSVTLRKYIYVVGNTPRSTSLGMIAQVYDQETDTWVLLPSPLISRYNFAVVAYQERIFVIGGSKRNQGLKAVEVFDLSKGEWTTKKELPYSYYEPIALLLNDNLIVYESRYVDDHTNLNTNPSVQWSEELESWIPAEPSSPLNDLHRYQFFTLDNPECISMITRKNKDPETTFEKSPFN